MMAGRVLFVDDDRYMRTVAEFLLRREGYEVRTATNAEEALKALEHEVPDVIVSDVVMPGMDGYELCRRVREDPKMKEIPFIFLSAKVGPEDRVRGLDVGADDYVTKPFQPQELLAKLRVTFKRLEIYRRQREELGLPGVLPSVLVVDDEPFWVKVLTRQLEQAGFRVRTASDGQEALEVLQRFRPDLILSDVMMPHMDGMELRRRLSEDSRFSDIPFVFLTARSGEEEALEGLALGADDYISKATSPQVVVQKVRAVCRRVESARRKVRRELEEATGRIPLQFLPESPPEMEGFLLAHRYEPFEDTPGGDYYDYLPLRGGALAVAIGDVMGKKWRAWFFSLAYLSYLRSVVRTAIRGRASAGEILSEVNNLLVKDLKVSEVFNTLFLMVLNPGDGAVSYASASHPPPLCYRAASGVFEELIGEGILLGLSEGTRYGEQEVQMSPGDVVVLYTDGITEAMNPSGELYGLERLKEVVAAHGGGVPEELIQAIYRDVKEFQEGNPPEDDRTVLVVRRT
ncbi:MAG TPA: response regulator [Candidatus Latescibacteria bacterium]|nr:response regulator [Candidatus Latescibacterota bacterium]